MVMCFAAGILVGVAVSCGVLGWVVDSALKKAGLVKDPSVAKKTKGHAAH